MADEKIRYLMKDYAGNPTSIPAERVQAFLARQEELKAMAERGEKLELDVESKEEIKKSIKALRKMFGPKGR